MYVVCARSVCLHVWVRVSVCVCACVYVRTYRACLCAHMRASVRACVYVLSARALYCLSELQTHAHVQVLKQEVLDACVAALGDAEALPATTPVCMYVCMYVCI